MDPNNSIPHTRTPKQDAPFLENPVCPVHAVAGCSTPIIRYLGRLSLARGHVDFLAVEVQRARNGTSTKSPILLHYGICLKSY